MSKLPTHIAIVRSSLVYLSSLSLVSAIAIQESLSAYYERVEIVTVDTEADLDRLVRLRPDIAFMGMKYVPGALPGSRVWVSTVLEAHGIAYTGSGQVAGEFEMNKSLAKRQIQAAGLKTSQFLTVTKGSLYEGTNMPLNYPLFVKPTSLGGGTGVDGFSVVHSITDLQAKIRSLDLDHDSDALIEEFLPGREFSVAVLQDELSESFHVMPIELVAVGDLNGDRMLSQQVKSMNEEVVLPVDDPLTRLVISELAIGAFKALQAKGYGRFDIRMDAFGIPHFLEANLIPSLIDGYGSFPKACKMNLNMDYEDMLLTIVRLCFAHTGTDLGAERNIALPTGA